MQEDEWVLLPSTRYLTISKEKCLQFHFLFHPLLCDVCNPSAISQAVLLFWSTSFYFICFYWTVSYCWISVFSRARVSLQHPNIVYTIKSFQNIVGVYLDSGCHRAVSLHFKLVRWEVLQNHITERQRWKLKMSRQHDIKAFWLLRFPQKYLREVNC